MTYGIWSNTCRAAVAATSTLLVGVFFINPAHATNIISKSTDHVSGEIVLKIKGAELKQAQLKIATLLRDTLGQNSMVNMESFATDQALQKIKIARDQDLQKAIKALSQDSNVQYAEPNYLYHAFDDGVPSDPEFNKLWGMHNIGQADSAGQVGIPGADINVLPLWTKGVTGSRNVVVAVIDTGIDWDHPGLKNNLYTNPNETPSDGIDHDHNGFINDIHGWNFAAKTNNSRDDHFHGTHCAGTIGGEGTNGGGVLGVNWKVSLMPIKFLTSSGGGTLADAVEAINYGKLMKVNVMSNSWGGGGFSQAMKDSIDAVKAAGILFVAAAGNDSSNNDSSPSYPASYDVDNVVSVAAIDNQEKLANFSNYGTRSVHVAAPGVNIYSTVTGGKFESHSGTSMATPHVAGVAALLMSGNPGWNYAEVKDRLIKTSEPVRGLRKKVFAKGRVSAKNAYYNIIPPTSEPDERLWKTLDQAVESPHPYTNSLNQTWKVQSPGAKYLRVIFEKVDTEANYDKVSVEEPNGTVLDTVSGKQSNYTSDYVKGDTAVIRLKTDASNDGWGFKISKIQVITDAEAVALR